jgi:hypothetical protein
MGRAAAPDQRYFERAHRLPFWLAPIACTSQTAVSGSALSPAPSSAGLSQSPNSDDASRRLASANNCVTGDFVTDLEPPTTVGHVAPSLQIDKRHRCCPHCGIRLTWIETRRCAGVALTTTPGCTRRLADDRPLPRSGSHSRRRSSDAGVRHGTSCGPAGLAAKYAADYTASFRDSR